MAKNISPTPQIRLPFDKKKRGGVSSWIYRHRVGVLVTVIIYLSAAILFLSYRIVIKPAMQSPIEIEFAEEQAVVPIVEQDEQPKDIEKIEMEAYEKMLNRSSDANSKLNSELRDNKRNNASEIYKEAERVKAQMAEGQAAYDRSMNEIATSAGRKSEKNQKSQEDKSKSGTDDKRQSAKYSGSVSVEWNLPGRYENNLHVPAYQCQNAGRVVVAIMVNSNGRVVTATVDKSTSSTDPCIMDMAVKAALSSSFNASASAPERQKGTITYTFKAQ